MYLMMPIDNAQTPSQAWMEWAHRLMSSHAKLLDAANIAALHFRRNKASGEFQGDDEHEAWTALEAAIAKAEGR